MKVLQNRTTAEIVIALVGNKIDLSIMRCIQTDEAQTYAYEHGLLFMETSAKTNVNITKIFKEIGMYNKIKIYFKNEFHFEIILIDLAEKLPKNETNTTGRGRYLGKSERTKNKGLNNCCN